MHKHTNKIGYVDINDDIWQFVSQTHALNEKNKGAHNRLHEGAHNREWQPFL